MFYADETEILGPVVFFDNLVSNAHKRPFDGGIIHDFRLDVHCVLLSFRCFGNKKALLSSEQGIKHGIKTAVILMIPCRQLCTDLKKS